MHTNFPNNDKPQTFNGDLGALPAALVPLTALPRWIVWRWVKKSAKAKWTKPPYKARNPQRNAATITLRPGVHMKKRSPKARGEQLTASASIYSMAILARSTSTTAVTRRPG
jgi:hypothetical protein